MPPVALRIYENYSMFFQLFYAIFSHNLRGHVHIDHVQACLERYVIVLPWVVRLYVEIIHELKRVDYLTYRWTNMV